MTIVEIFKQLKEARLAAGRTLRDVGKAAGIAQPTLSMAESGRRSGMRGENLVAWAATLGLELTLREVGPGSTSPEPGPPTRACNCNPELFGGKHRWQCPSVPAAVVLNDIRAESTKDGPDVQP